MTTTSKKRCGQVWDLSVYDFHTKESELLSRWLILVDLGLSSNVDDDDPYADASGYRYRALDLLSGRARIIIEPLDTWEEHPGWSRLA